MGADTKIQWCHHTFNPWWGCTRVSPGCERCYAETWDRFINARDPHWGARASRRFASDDYWRNPIKWNAAAAAAGEQHRVFCASMADVFEQLPEGHPDADRMERERDRLWLLIKATPSLTWLLLTKRPENITRLMPGVGQQPNVWLGTTVEDQQRATERIPKLLAVPAGVRFLSMEPLLGPINLNGPWPLGAGANHGIDWFIIGGESGARARPFHVEWARDLLDQVRRGGAAPFVKQLGAAPTVNFYDDEWREWFESQGRELPGPIGWSDGDGQPRIDSRILVRGKDKAGGDMTEWPPALRVRELPGVARG